MFLLLLLPYVGSAQGCPVFPHPASFVLNTGDYFFRDVISVSKRDVPSFMLDDLKWFFPQDLKINAVFVNDGGDIQFKRLINVPTDHYSISVDDKITISYSNDASLFYALQSLKQLVKEEGGSQSLPKCFIADEPKFEWRGMHLDVSRHFFTVAEVKRYIDLMARYKFNRFHWHLTDDQGWRIEIKKYSKLTEIGSIREQTIVGHAGNSPEEYDDIREVGFYTQDQIKEIVKYAQDRFIVVVPEIEMPGHARAALAAYPEFSCDGSKHPVAEKWGVFEEVFCSKDATLNFLKDIIDEVCDLFPGQYIHVGGDEVPKTKWKNCPNCQDKMKKLGLANEEELQSYFIRVMDQHLTSKGKTLIGWDEILEGGLSPNAVVMSWRGVQGGIDAAEMDHKVVMTPGSHCYFDHYQSDRRTEPLAIGGFTPLEKVYAFNPIPETLRKDKQGLVLGAQANVWTEYMADFAQVEYMILPRMIALSEVLWGTNKLPYEEFLKRFEVFEMPYLEKMGVNFSKAAFYIQAQIDVNEEGLELTFDSVTEKEKLDVNFKPNKNIIRLSKTKLLLKKTNKPTKSTVMVYSGSGGEEDSTSVTLMQHSTLGELWDISPNPSSFYSGKGPLTLTDGVIGGRPWNGKEWLGFETPQLDLKLTLNERKKVAGINMSFLQAESSWVYLPKEVVVHYSKNGRKWKERPYTIYKETIRLNIGRKMKFIHLEIHSMEKIPDGKNGAGHTPWLFLDEIYLD